MLTIAGVHMEAGVLMRDSVPHGAFKDTVIDERHSRLLEWLGKGMKSELLTQTTPVAFGFIGPGESDIRHTTMSANPRPLRLRS